MELNAYAFLAFIVNDAFQDKKYLYSDEKHSEKIEIMKNNEKMTWPLPLTSCEDLESRQLAYTSAFYLLALIIFSS